MYYRTWVKSDYGLFRLNCSVIQLGGRLYEVVHILIGHWVIHEWVDAFSEQSGLSFALYKDSVSHTLGYS